MKTKPPTIPQPSCALLCLEASRDRAVLGGSVSDQLCSCQKGSGNVLWTGADIWMTRQTPHYFAEEYILNCKFVSSWD